MEFSFSTRKWVPQELLGEVHDYRNDFDFMLPVFLTRCSMLSSTCYRVSLLMRFAWQFKNCWKDPKLPLSPYDVRSHAEYLNHLVVRSGRWSVQSMSICLL